MDGQFSPGQPLQFEGQPRNPWRRATLREIIDRQGLTSGLSFALDAADSVSYTSGQTWVDRSGNGNDFYRGATSGAEASDPTFNGAAGGRSSAEYWSFDGGDYFSPTGAQTFDDAWSKNSATYTLIAAVYIPDLVTAAMGIFSNENALSLSGIGTALIVNTGEALGLVVSNGGGSAFAFSGNPSGIGTLDIGAWNIVGVSVDEASAAGGNWLLNGGVANFNPTYSSPSASNPSQSPKVMAYGNASLPAQNTARLGWIAGWGAALSAAQLASFWTATRSRYGII